MKHNKTIFLIASLLIQILLISGCSKEDPETLRKETMLHQITGEINADTLESYVIWLQEMGTRFTLAENRRDVAEKIKRKFIQIGYPETRLDSFWLTRTYKNVVYQQWQYNVIATLESAILSDSVCVMGGHYDSIIGTGDPFIQAPGANDNASGIAAALEVARVLRKSNFKSSHNIEFVAFGAEELGLYGSNHFATGALNSLKKIKMMLNNDMIAFQPGDSELNWSVNIIDYDNSHYLREKAANLCNKYTVLRSFNDNAHQKQSDSYPFFLNGYQALFFASEIMDPNYHSLNDLAANCNFVYCREIVKISCALLVDMNFIRND